MMMLWNDLMNRMRGRLTCGETLEILQQYLDGEINAEEARRVAEHLDACSRCEEESEIYRKIKLAIAASAETPDSTVVARLERFGERIADGEVH